MGGIAGAKGYVFQAFSAVIESLEKEDWFSVRLEHVLYDKVDIFWDITGDGSNVKVNQVKTSINSFKIKTIGNTLQEIMDNFSIANKYELTLIGPVDSDANDFVRKINENRKFTSSEEKNWSNLERNYGKIFIKHYSTDNEDELFKIASENLNYFLEKKEIRSTAAQRMFILEALTGMYCILETSGSYITRTEFEEKILFIYKQCSSLKLHNNLMKIGSALAINPKRTEGLAYQVGTTLAESGYQEKSESVRALSIKALDTVNFTKMESFGIDGREVYNCYNSHPFVELYDAFLNLGLFKNLQDLLGTIHSIEDAKKLSGSLCYYIGSLHRKGFNIDKLENLPYLSFSFSKNVKFQFEYHPSYICSYTSRSDLTSGTGMRTFLVLGEIKKTIEENGIIKLVARVYLISDPVPENLLTL
ncbi:hypothetical protein CN277_18455 [Bacillus cereus]|uniref:hypothetical protein n=1 Tax=Bacillus cereus group TaxID=86661 RepID=UPI000BED359C|nr:hypothetical protein [Bacillus cereus]PEC80020.1 hypothetical protein CON08_06370 [Bacillus cereus]PEE58102.1 hypothetical protein COM68_15940 [Bacillus cereus]PFC56177.1 hypothetical protein CN267_30255 [Bacillus cereus]PFD00686.1 hypothetical protein CN277_18455 [Bacillus cereus]PFQ16677.1 hypothetical protein COK04_11210 [Bacillus cereus]